MPNDYYDQPGQDEWWQGYVYDSTQKGLDILGARYGENNYYSPDDPRFRQSGRAPVPVGNPPQYVGGGQFVPGTVSTQGFQINWWTAALGGLLIGAFVLGKNRR